jgi:hypothetical protein
MGCLGIGDEHPKMLRTKAVAIDTSWKLNIFDQALAMASPFKLPSQCKTCSPPLLKGARWQSGQYSILKASVFCITTARVLDVSPTSEKTEKGNGLQSIEIHRRWSDMLIAHTLY